MQRQPDRKSTRLNSSHMSISYAVFCLKKKNAGNSARELQPEEARGQACADKVRQSATRHHAVGRVIPILPSQIPTPIAFFFLSKRGPPESTFFPLPNALQT